MTLDEAKIILINRGFVETDGFQAFDGDKWRNAIATISKWLEQQPCEDCISRQEAINCVTFNEFRYKMVEDIKILPSVTPKEKTAAWVPTDEEPHEIYECNACGWLLYDQDRTDFKYCPNCGARMVSECR